MLSKPKLLLTKTQLFPAIRYPAITSEKVLVHIFGWGIFEVRYRESPNLGYQLLSRIGFRTDQSSELIRPVDAELHICVWNIFGKSELFLTPLRWSDDQDERLAYTQLGPQKLGVITPVSFKMGLTTQLIKSHGPKVSAQSNPKFRGLFDQLCIASPQIKVPPVTTLSIQHFSIKLPSSETAKSSEY